MGGSRKYWWALGLALLQGYFLSAATTAIMINLVLILVVFEGFNDDLISGLKFALWSGFWLDVASDHHFGWRMIWFAALLLVVRWLKRTGVRNNSYSGTGLIIFGASLFYNLCLWLSLWLFDSSLVSLVGFIPAWLGEALITAAIAVILQGRLSTGFATSKPLYEI